MGLIIKSTEAKSINSIDLDGVNVELEQVYARIECAFRPNGTTIEAAFPYIFKSKSAFNNGAQSLSHNIAKTSTIGEVVGQTLLSAHELCAAELVNLGYSVDIDL